MGSFISWAMRRSNKIVGRFRIRMCIRADREVVGHFQAGGKIANLIVSQRFDRSQWDGEQSAVCAPAAQSIA